MPQQMLQVDASDSVGRKCQEAMIHFGSYVSQYVLMQTSNVTCVVKPCLAEEIKNRLNLQSKSGKSGHKKVTKLLP